MPLQNPASTVKWTFLDYTSKTSVVELNTNENLGIVGMAQQLTDLQTLEDAFAGISGGAIIKQEFAPYVTSFIASEITNENNQRERRWIVVFEDEFNGEEGQVTLPCARVSNSVGAPIVDAEGFAILTMPQWTKFKAEFEKVARSIHGNFVTFKYAYIQDENV